MSDELLVATRKGLFVMRRAGGSWSVAETHFLGEPLSMVLRDGRDGTLYAALNLGHFGVKFWRRETAGDWQECAVPAYPKVEDGDGPSLEQIWALEPGGADEPGVLWAGTLPGGLFRSEDRGASWSLNRALWDHPQRAEWFGGGYDHPGIHSVCVDPRDSARVAVAVSTGGVWLTRDRGASWTQGAKGMRAEYLPPEKAYDADFQDVHRMVQCADQPDAFWVQHHNGIFRSTDGSQSWQEVKGQPSSFGFAVAVHPRDPDTAWFVPAVKDQCRVPVDAQFVVSRTRDGGKSFELLREGLPSGSAYDLVYRHGLTIDASGERLAIGSTTGGLWISENGGERWTCLSAHLPPVYCVRFA